MTTIRLCVTAQICCGLCIYRRQFGLRICCGNDNNDGGDGGGGVASQRGGRRKTHVVLAAQYNRAFDDLVAAVDARPPSTKDNGVVAAAAETSTGEQASEHAEEDATDANAGTDGELLEDGTAASAGLRSANAPADSVDVEDANQAQVVADDEKTNVVEATTNDESEIDDIVSDRSPADADRSPQSRNKPFASCPSKGNESSSSATREEMVEPDSQLNVNDDSLTDKTLQPEVEFMQVALPEAENNCQTTTAPVARRWRSMGAGSRQRWVVDTLMCDKAVNVHEDDLAAQPEPEIVTGNETDATTNEEARSQEEGAVKEQSGGDGKTEGRTSVGEAMRSSLMMGNIVVDLDELGILAPEESKQEEMKVTVPISICLMIIAGYIFIGSVLFTLWEDWDYLTGSYFCFVTLSTIGFGDIVPGTGLKEWEGAQKLIFCAVWMAFGLSLLAMCFSLMQEEVKEKFEWCGRKLGLLKKEEVDGD